MKKLLFSAIVCVSILAACKKSDSLGPDQQPRKTAVKFDVSDFGLQTSSTGKAPSFSLISEVGDTLKNYASFLYYRVYSSSGGIVKTKSQTSADANFGIITDSLVQGTYTVVFAASKKALVFNNSALESDFFRDEANSFWDDTFYKKISLTVGATTVNQAVKLERIVAGLQLNIQENLPSTIVQVTITAEDEDGIYKLSTNTSATPAAKTRSWTIFVGQPQPKYLLMHILNTNRPQQITIRAYDRGGTLVITRIINNVSFYPNRKTVFTGDLTVNVGLSVQVNPIWNTPTQPVRY